MLLDLERGDGSPSGKRQFGQTRHIARDGANMVNGLVDVELRQLKSGLQHFQDEERGAHFERHGGLGHIGIAHDDVHAAEAFGIAVWFIPGIDDGARTGGGRRHAFPDLVCPLREQELGRLIALSGLHHAGAADELAGNKERKERQPQILEHHVAADEVVFVAAKRIAG